jgi:Rrf2 family cysteine metabolism transcriptional repressor
MLFSTNAEYGVRLMVELGSVGPESTPIFLSSVAEGERLPLSYL